MGCNGFSSARDRLVRAQDEPLDPPGACERVAAAMAAVARFDRCAVLMVDRETMLPTTGVVKGFDPAACAPFWDNELLDPDFQKFTDLARSNEPVGVLSEVTDGDLARSPRFQKLWRPTEAADELRVAFRSGTTCLAIGSFVRPLEAGWFTEQEVADVRRLVPTATVLLRRVLSDHLGWHAVHPGAVIILDGEGELASMSAGSGALLDDLRVNSIETDRVPGVLRALATKARSGRVSTSVTSRVRADNGCWLRATATPMEGERGTVAITIEPARADDLIDVQLESYGLTGRESEIVLLLCRGFAAKEIAAELMISVHTVRDHIKTIYGKAEVTSRGELVAKLFTDRLLVGLEHAVVKLS